MVSREVRCVSMLPLRFRANSIIFRYSHYGFPRILASRGLFRPLLGRSFLDYRSQRRVGWDGALVSTLPLGFRTNSITFRCSHCGFVRIPLNFDVTIAVSHEFLPLVASSGFFRPLLGRALRLPTAMARAARRGLGYDAPAVISREFRCVAMLPL